MSNLIAAYQGATPTEQAIVQLLAAACEALPRKALLEALDRLAIRDGTGYAFQQKSLLPVLQGLDRRQLLRLSTAGTACAPELVSHVLKAAISSGRFQPMSQVLLQVLPVKAAWGGYSFKLYDRFLRHLRYRLLVGDSWETLEPIFEAAYLEFSRKMDQEHPLVTLFATPFDADYLALFPDAVQIETVMHLLHVAWSQLRPVAAVFDFLRRLSAKGGQVAQSASEFLTYYLTLWGDWQAAATLLAASPAAFHRPGLAGWHQALAGHDREAIRLYAEDHARIAKLTGKRKVFFQDVSGVFYLLALLRSGEAGHLATVTSHVTLIESLKNHALRPYCQPLRRAVNLLGGRKPEPRDPYRSWDRHPPEAGNPCQQFFRILADYWEDKDYCRQQWRTTLANYRDRARAAGMVWLAADCAELLARLGIAPEANEGLASELRAAHGLVSVIDAVRLADPWERSLRALIGLGGGKGQAEPSAKGAASQRLIWRLAVNQRHGSCELIPRLQSLGKTGKWSAGRPVALKKLRDEAKTMAGLSDQDRAACATIKASFQGYYYERREVYQFEAAKALTALVGHPQLYLEEAPDCRIDLVAGEPELTVTRHRGQIVVKLEPALKDEVGDYQLRKETPTRYKLVRFSPQHKAIAAILDSGLKAPERAEALAVEAIGALAPLITIHSDLVAGVADSREVAADPSPHIHLLPYQDGLKAEILVKPFAEAEAWFRPGQGGQKVFAEVGGEKLSAARDLKREREAASRLLDLCPTLGRQEEHNGEYLVASPEDSLELLLELKAAGDGLTVAWPQGESLRVRGRVVGASGLGVRIKQERDWFKASGELSFDEGGVLALHKLLALLDQAQGRFVRLDDGSFLALTKEFKSRLLELKAYGELRGDGLRLSPFAAFALDDLSREAGEVKADRHWREHIGRLNQTIDPELPSTLQAELRDYQVAGFRWLAQLAHWGVGACLADDMGLGKTIQALALLLRLAPDGPSLVVAPLSVLMNWQDEASRFAPTLRVVVFGPGDRQQTLDGLQAFDLVVCSYGLLQIEGARLAKVAWQGVVLDEAQAIKNMHTKRSKAAMHLNGRFKLITTGTPVENHLGELWNLFDFITPGLLGTFQHFNRTFMAAVSPEEDKKSRQRLKNLIQPFILRRLKSQVLQELPARTEVSMRVEMSPEEAALYEAQRRKALDSLALSGDEPQGQQQIRILAEIMRLRRLCCNPALVLPDCKIASSKLRVFGDLLTDILGNRHKALVFSQFVDHLAILARFLDQRAIGYQYLDGSTSAAARRRRISDFQAGKGDVFLISLKAGGSGLNLTAADYVIHMDPWWNPAVEDQASDRAHRLGQQRPVTIYRLVVADSIEEQIIKLHQEKRDLADSLLAGGDLSAKMSAGELLALLKEQM